MKESHLGVSPAVVIGTQTITILLSYSFVGKTRKDEEVPLARPLELFTNSKGRSFVKFTLDGLNWYSYPLQKKVSSKES